MTGRKNRRIHLGGRTATVAFSLCLLAVVTMIGMYTVGRSEQKQKQLEQQVAEAREQKMLEEARQKELAQERQEAASAAAKRQKEKEESEKQKEKEGSELESEFRKEQNEKTLIPKDTRQESASDGVTAEAGPLSFSAEKEKLLWPVAGDIILDYSMDKSVYFSTLDQYKYNPAVIIQGGLNESVMCGAKGKVISVKTLEETGTTVTVDIGSGYQLIYGQLKELLVKEGDSLKSGTTIGHVSEPTKYYTKEGSNVYFEVRKDGKSMDPMTLLQ